MPAGKSSPLNPGATPLRPGPARQSNDPRRGRITSPPTSPAGPPDGTRPLEKAENLNTNVKRELIDDMMDMYVDWREACIGLRKAYERWSSMRSAEREMAFAAYGAALDWEEQASAVYADRINRVVRELRSASGRPSAR
jgi:hypothetical protein